MKNTLFTICSIIGLILMSCSDKPNTETVKNFSIERYMGLWYEIARIDHSFEKDLVGCTAQYTLLPDGKVEITNTGFENTLQGKLKTSKGVAKIPNLKHPGSIRVSFFGGIYSAYNILALDTINYQYSLVGGNSKDYLWILSRNPTLSDDTQLMLIEIAKARGYNVDKLIFPPQPVLEIDLEKEEKES